MKTFVLQVLVATLVSLATVAAYERLVARPARTIGVVDALSVLRLEEQRLAGQMVRDMSVEQKERVAMRARTFARDFPRVLDQIAMDCGCLVVDRSAVVGTPPHMVDLTPELKRRMQ